MDLFQHLGEIILGKGENHSDGLDLSDYSQNWSTAGLHEIARINKTQTDTPGKWRDNVTVGKLYLVEIKGSLIGSHESFVLGDDLFLIVQLLFRDRVSAPRGLIARQLHFCVCQGVGVACRSARRCLDLRLDLAGIDVDQRVTFLNGLSFSIMD